ncbi:MAG: hypothetical protein RL702_1676 [Pseudomonadota bacterium]|jgi:hypothetical protein
MSITKHFSQIGAPLVNVRWSWGAHGRCGRTVVRAWKDESIDAKGGRYIRLINHAAYEQKQSHPGYRERQRHIEGLRQGNPTYAIILEVKDPLAKPRTIKIFDRGGMWELGDLISVEGDDYARLVRYVSLAEFLDQGPAT